MKGRISAGKITGTVKAPGSKSFSQRYILMAALSSAALRIHGISYSDDEQVAIGIAKASGSTMNFNGDTLDIVPEFCCPETVDVGESATSYRLALGLLAAKKCMTEFRGKQELARRPMNELASVLESMGARIEIKDDGFITLDATDLMVSDMEIDQTRSSQYVSSLLMLLAMSGEGEKKLCVRGTRSSEGYVDITASCLRTMGYDVIRDEGTYRVVARAGEGAPRDVLIERDYSSAAFFLVLGVLSSEEGIYLKELPEKSLQGDSVILDILRGSSSGVSVEYSEDTAIVKASRSPVSGVEIDAMSAPDLAPPISILGIFSRDGVVIRNPSRLRIKESDRYGEIVRLVRSFGAEVQEGEDYLRISAGSKVLNPGHLEFTDHRMIMSAIVAGLASGHEIQYDNLERINKSYPSFLGDLKKVGAAIKTDASL